MANCETSIYRWHRRTLFIEITNKLLKWLQPSSKIPESTFPKSYWPDYHFLKFQLIRFLFSRISVPILIFPNSNFAELLLTLSPLSRISILSPNANKIKFMENGNRTIEKKKRNSGNENFNNENFGNYVK